MVVREYMLPPRSNLRPSKNCCNGFNRREIGGKIEETCRANEIDWM